MKDGPDIARIAALIGDPARANMLTALLGGRALTASELAPEAGITAQTARSHLARLVSWMTRPARSVRPEQQGPARLRRHSEEELRPRSRRTSESWKPHEQDVEVRPEHGACEP